MKRYSRTLHFFTHGIRGLLLALICAAALFVSGCSKDGDTINQVPTPTTGTLNVTVNPPSTTVVVTGPNSFTQTFSGNNNLTNLEPGLYTAKASAPGFEDATGSATVVIDKTVSIALVLTALPIVANAPRTVYRDGSGNLIPVTAGQFASGQYVFYAWLQDLPDGIVPANLTAATVTDPNAPRPAERTETAPSLTQNLAAAWVGVKDAAGVIHPVIGADVRWTIEEDYAGKVGSIIYGASDDNIQIPAVRKMKHIDDPHQASTRTNNKNLANERFPLEVTEYPLYNQTGIGTPSVDGFTWVTLFSADKIASGRITVVATVNGEEIGKQILYKNFAPQPKIAITKAVASAVVNLVGGTATDTWTITVTNTGEGNATNIVLNDTLASGAGASYTLSGAPGTLDAGSDGFTFTIPSLPGGSSAFVTYSPVATVTAAGIYCNQGQITSYDDAAINTVYPVDLKAQACFTALASNVSIVKDFVVSATDNTSLGTALTVNKNVPATLRVQVINNGTGDATTVVVHDTLTSGSAANYTVSGFSAGTPNATGFDSTITTLTAGSTATYLYTVAASVDAVYCDTATVTATSGTIGGTGSSSACLTVATPNLTIAKTDAPTTVMPGASYTSTIVVRNTGTATATGVVVSDLLGFNSTANVWAIYMSSPGTAGTLSNNNHTVTAPSTVDIAAGASITFTVVSQIPPGAAAGNYCNTASVASTNAASPTPVEVCVIVPAFVAFQVQLTDLGDLQPVGNNIVYSSVLYIEPLSNEGVNYNTMRYSFGLPSPTGFGTTAGVFTVLVSTSIYHDPTPVIDPTTGAIVSDQTNTTSVQLTEGTNYTLDNSTPGLQVITITPSMILAPNGVFYIVQVVQAPAGSGRATPYHTGFLWDSVGTVGSTHYEVLKTEPTTVTP